MRPWEKWSFHILTLIVTATGVVYFIMKDLMETNDPFSVVNHPLQPLMINLHLLAAPALVFVMGIILNSHVARKLGKKRIPNKKTGWIALVTFPTMVFSGYLLPMVTDPLSSRVVLILHLASGGVFAVSYAVHQIISLKLLRRSRRTDGAGAVNQRLAA